MNLGELIDATRGLLQDRAKPYLWTDDELAEFARQAELEACERAQLILDTSTPQVVQIQVKATVATYALHPSILKIERAKLDNGDRPLIETSYDQMDQGGSGWFPSGLNQYPPNATWFPGGSNWDTLQGQPERYIPNDDRSILLIRIPVEDDVLRMRVHRGPIRPMRAPGDCPEIHQRHHFRLIDWMARCAYRKQDPQTLDQKKADGFEAAFTDSFGVRPDANVQRKRRDGRSHIVQMGTW